MKNPFSLVVSFVGWIFDRTLLILELSVDLMIGVLDSFLRVFRTLYGILKYMIYYRTLQPPRDVWEYGGFTYIANTLILGYIGLVLILNFFAFFPIVPETINKIANYFAAHERQYITAFILLLFVLPKQRILRDPVTRKFFRRGWFKDYGSAYLFTKYLSFLFIILCLCGIYIHPS